MNYILIGHSFENEIQTVTQIFFPNEKFEKVESITDLGITVVSEIKDGNCYASIFVNSVCETSEFSKIDGKFEPRYLVKKTMFTVLKIKTNQKTEWGMLTGIRPSKIMHELWEKDFSDVDIVQYMSELYGVSEKKVNLCLQVAKAEKKIIENNDNDTISVYIGIPFCPSRCLYCSFTSFDIQKFDFLVDDYLSALIREMKYIKEYCANKKVSTIYIGGGTPTSLNEKQLEILLKNITECFGTNTLDEYTVEAGRADSLNEEKLRLLKAYGVTRISINPQTMKNESLKLIGRNHSVEQFIECFKIARKVGHDNINIDLIVGLPNENAEDVFDTLTKAEELNAENITVHTLAIKRASRLKGSINEYNLTDMSAIEKMLDIVEDFAKKRGLKPYYMYRQKNMVGNFENVGYCKPSKECIYNVQIMAEKQTIVAIGAGAVTKLVDVETNRIERIFNVKDVIQYIERIDEMIQRKKDGC